MITGKVRNLYLHRNTYSQIQNKWVFKQIFSKDLHFRFVHISVKFFHCNVCTQKLAHFTCHVCICTEHIHIMNYNRKKLRVPYILRIYWIQISSQHLSTPNISYGFLILFLLLVHAGKVFRKCGICKDIPVKFYHPVICIFGTLYDYNKSGIQIRDGHEVVSFGNWYVFR